MAYDKRKMQDFHSNEIETWMEYVGYFNTLKTSSDPTEIQAAVDGINALSSDETFKYKIMSAYNWNRLINLVNDSTGVNAPEWDSSVLYQRSTIVNYNDNLYAALQDNANVAPTGSTTNNQYWVYLSSLSDATPATEDSLVGAWQQDYSELLTKYSESHNWVIGDWITNFEYKTNSLVKLDDYHSYYCIQENISSSANMPPNDDYWVLAKGLTGLVGIPVGEDTPQGIVEGDIYLTDVSSDYSVTLTFPDVLRIVSDGQVLSSGDEIIRGSNVTVSFITQKSAEDVLNYIKANGISIPNGGTIEILEDTLFTCSYIPKWIFSEEAEEGYGPGGTFFTFTGSGTQGPYTWNPNNYPVESIQTDRAQNQVDFVARIGGVEYDRIGHIELTDSATQYSYTDGGITYFTISISKTQISVVSQQSSMANAYGYLEGLFVLPEVIV